MNDCGEVRREMNKAQSVRQYQPATSTEHHNNCPTVQALSESRNRHTMWISRNKNKTKKPNSVALSPQANYTD
jgi:hypothetical protein